MVSELAMNAVQYARTDFQVRIQVARGTLRVEVADSGAGHPAPRHAPPPSSPHGRGLLIVRRMADDWGVSPAGACPGKVRVVHDRPAGGRTGPLAALSWQAGWLTGGG